MIKTSKKTSSEGLEYFAEKQGRTSEMITRLWEDEEGDDDDDDEALGASAP